MGTQEPRELNTVAWMEVWAEGKEAMASRVQLAAC